MDIENNKLNETEIIYPSDISVDEKNIFCDENKSNILINSLKTFNENKIENNKTKFLMNYNDIITLIKLGIEYQIKINNSINVYYDEICNDFIQNIKYYFLSFETINNNKNNKKINNNRYKKKIEEEKNNINHISISVNRSQILNIKNKQDSKTKKNKNNDNNINYKKDGNNKSVEKKSKSRTIYPINLSKNEKNNNKLNKSVEKRKSKEITKNKNTQSFSIFTVCENIKNTSFTGKPKRKNNDNKKNIYLNQYKNSAIKRQILGNNIIKPSNMANKLLQKGIKYINEFAFMKEEERKKRY